MNEERDLPYFSSSLFNFVELKVKVDRNTILEKIWNHFLDSASIEFSTNFVVNLKLMQQLSTVIFFISNITKFQVELFLNLYPNFHTIYFHVQYIFLRNGNFPFFGTFEATIFIVLFYQKINVTRRIFFKLPQKQVTRMFDESNIASYVPIKIIKMTGFQSQRAFSRKPRLFCGRRSRSRKPRNPTIYRGSSDPLGFETQIGGMAVVHGRLSNIEEDVARDMIRGENSRLDR